MSFANDDTVRTIEPGFLAPADGNEAHHRDTGANRARTPEPESPAVSHRSATHTGVAKSAIAPNQSRHSRRRPEASVRLRHRLQSLPIQARCRSGRPHRRTPENHLTHARTRRRFAYRSRRQPPAPQPAPLPPRPLIDTVFAIPRV